MVRQQSGGIRLPQSILDEINGTSEQSRGRGHGSKSKLSRKEARKQEREGRKQRKAQYFSTAHTTNPVKRRAEDDHVDSPKRKKAKTESGAAPPAPAARVGKQDGNATSSKEKAAADKKTTPAPDKKVKEKKAKDPKKPSALAKLAGETSKKSSKVTPRSRVEADEDNYIAYLESKLGLKGGKKKKSNPEEDDGLDDLLDFASKFDSFDGAAEAEESESEEESEEEEESDDAMDEDETFDDEEEWQGIFTSDAPSSAATETLSPAPEPAAPATRYVPPHLRNKAAAGDGQNAEVIAKLTKKLKGLLNRMTEQNLGSIIEGVEETYRQNRRHDVTSTLTKLIIEGTSSHALLLDSYVVLHAAFVAALHKIVGVEFAAYFVQTLVAEYERHRAEAAGVSAQPSASTDAATDASHNIDTNALSTNTDPSQQDSSTTDITRDGAGKECSNLIVLISELYNFQVVSCVLVYDIVRSLLAGGMDELDVELLLKVVRNSGQQLRADDPSALKDIIQIVQGKVEGKGGNLSSRAKFMIETLTNLKNNKAAKSKKGQQGQTGGNEAVERMKKFLNGMAKKRHVLAHEPLRVTLEDLHSAESRGKWWLVGAAWGGDPLVERQGENGVDGPSTGLNGTIGSSTNTTKPKESAESKLLKLARKQGMNTDIRRSIFVVLMSSDDYVDACERLGQLNLTEVQQREIVRVLLHCCGNEAAYNPYYALVGQHLCRQSHSYKITLQFCLWDFLRDLGETRVGGAEVVKNLGDTNDDSDDEERAKKISPARMRNVAKLYAWWIAKDATSLTILKPVDFTVLKPRGRAFLRELLVQVFVASQTASPVLGAVPQTRNRGAVEEVFIKAARVEALAMGLVYFITQVVMKEASADDAEGKFVKWAGGVAKETLRTGLDVVPGLTDDL
ncbi:hypothetical protein EV714DRAFT_253370 [Schizophyllum commune]